MWTMLLQRCRPSGAVVAPVRAELVFGAPARGVHAASTSARNKAMVEFEPHRRSRVMSPEVISPCFGDASSAQAAYQVNTPFREVVARPMVRMYVN